MDPFQIRLLTDADLKQCECLKAGGIYLPSTDFTLSPRFHSDGSVEFRLRMMVPAVAMFSFAAAGLIVWLYAVHTGGLAISTSTLYGLAGICLPFVLMGMVTARTGRSVRIWRDGRAELSVPSWLVARRVVRILPGQARLLVGLGFRRSDRLKWSERGIESRFAQLAASSVLNPGEPRYRTVPCLVIVFENASIPLTRGHVDKARVVQHLLQEDYTLATEPSPVLYRYQSLL